MRRQQLVTDTVVVFVQTNRFKPAEPQYDASQTVRLPVATADTGKLLTAARRALGAVWRPGFNYKKAGVMLLDLRPAGDAQGDLWEAHDDARSERLMAVLDGLNRDHGRGTVAFASCGTRQRWSLRSEQRSARFTTRFDELLSVS